MVLYRMIWIFNNQTLPGTFPQLRKKFQNLLFMMLLVLFTNKLWSLLVTNFLFDTLSAHRSALLN